jgi:hypothetical protein
VGLLRKPFDPLDLVAAVQNARASATGRDFLPRSTVACALVRRIAPAYAILAWTRGEGRLCTTMRRRATPRT